ncbi:NADH-quinone oxidoreductase subunit L [Sphingomonas sp. BN140010]|uniref:NADH-quinone oxidoreductase subunit L n=1 Tax=Sphingomonas arvum TaxID=2992113 RepID=A0ABT3JE30_9SPHN|nr:NADH-quinone oxidoreductase subunit L [Sphingomonas sp. BN140010]MCW3797331.1 NADH-quinone oxidoreductase subunit L [Sphingomonas sp. BN140010]
MHPIVPLVFLPLLAAIVAGLGGRLIGNTPAKVVTTGALFISAALAWPIFISFLSGSAEAQVVPVLEWINSGNLQVAWSLRVDALTAVMLVVITTVSSLVHLYSWGYMAEDPSQPRFFAYLSLFTFAMLMLVTADSLIQMFFGWEGVGLASYLLIGFWYYKPSANAAAIKAFVVNRVGDFGFSLGIFGTFLVFGTVSIPAILAAAPSMAGATLGFAGLRVDTMTLLCLLLFIGAMGKSAQLGLHTWLPDAMEGPTPVSALIHAATMVTAGVFMVCRLSPMFEVSPTALTVVTYVGAATAIFAATVGVVQNDIKRVIAYSTCSQLGYMFFAAGVGAYSAAMFHLFTHAFFKALLFLGAGSVIHAMHHEQDMRYYGALRKEIPFTFWAMLLGTLAITGVGIIQIGGFPGFGFAGFFSKDAILESAFANGSVHGNIAFFIGAFAALLTSFYSWRLIFLTFFGKARWAGSEHIQHAVHGDHHDHPDEEHGDSSHSVAHPTVGTAGYHPHESPWTMLVPLAVLSLGAVFAGIGFEHWFINPEGAPEFWHGSLFFNEHLAHAAHEVPLWVKLTPGAVMVLGFLIAWNNYIRDPSAPGRVVAATGALHTFLVKKWYFDELYDVIFVRPALWFGRLFWHRGDEQTIDRFGPHGAAYAVGVGNRITARIQSGYLNSYALVMLLGLVAVATWAIMQVAK